MKPARSTTANASACSKHPVHRLPVARGQPQPLHPDRRAHRAAPPRTLRRQRLSARACGRHPARGARIVTVADIFDALISLRPCQAAWSVEEALDYIRGRAARCSIRIACRRWSATCRACTKSANAIPRARLHVARTDITVRWPERLEAAVLAAPGQRARAGAGPARCLTVVLVHLLLHGRATAAWRNTATC